MKTVVVMPAFNEATVIGTVIAGLKKRGYGDILVVDDGSKDNTAAVAHSHGAHVLKHVINRGLGGALSTGIKAALLKGADIVVTFDSDGQHSPDDIEKVTKPIASKESECVIGYRTYPSSDMPFIRKVFNFVGNAVTFFLFGLKVKDSQSGFRAFSRDAASKIDIKSDRMEVSSEIIKEIGKNKLSLKEVPIEAIYTDYSLSKGQSFWVGVKTFWKLVVYRIRH